TRDTSYLINLKEGYRDIAFKQYREAEKRFDSKILKCCTYTNDKIQGINYEDVINSRKENFDYLNCFLGKHNRLILSRHTDEVPYAYPFLSKKVLKREYLIERQIFFPLLWPRVLNTGNQMYTLEKNIGANMFPLPIDQRYGLEEMKYIVNVINILINA